MKLLSLAKGGKWLTSLLGNAMASMILSAIGKWGAIAHFEDTTMPEEWWLALIIRVGL
jgi:hypothetical protein